MQLRFLVLINATYISFVKLWKTLINVKKTPLECNCRDTHETLGTRHRINNKSKQEDITHKTSITGDKPRGVANGKHLLFPIRYQPCY